MFFCPSILQPTNLLVTPLESANLGQQRLNIAEGFTGGQGKRRKDGTKETIHTTRRLCSVNPFFCLIFALFSFELNIVHGSISTVCLDDFGPVHTSLNIVDKANYRKPTANNFVTINAQVNKEIGIRNIIKHHFKEMGNFKSQFLTLFKHKNIYFIVFCKFKQLHTRYAYT